MSRRFHLAWFTNFTAGNWDGTFSHGGSPWDGRFFVDMALALERACFDYVIYEDKLLVPEAYRGTAETTLKLAQQVPKHDPVPLAAMVAAATSRLGVVATMSTLAWPPFMLARVSSTIDHIAGGRFGWNIVTSGEDLAAQNFGMDALPPRDTRYAMADEYMDLVNQLFDSWEPDAVVKDRARGIYADHRKVHPIHFEGQFFRCRGPLNTVPSPQRRPTYVQAGGSPRGRDFAAKHADSIIATANQIDGMKQRRHPRARRQTRTQPRRHQNPLPDLPVSRRDGRGGQGQTPPHRQRARVRRGRARGYRPDYRHRFLGIRTRQTAAQAHHQR